jgi:hypothetical protein
VADTAVTAGQPGVPRGAPVEDPRGGKRRVPLALARAVAGEFPRCAASTRSPTTCPCS